MSEDKIAEIRARHKRGMKGLTQTHHDRATLLAEVERHRAKNERLREVLEGIRIDGPDGDGLVWATIQHPSIAVRSHVMVGNVERMVSQAFLEFEQIRRKALEAKP